MPYFHGTQQSRLSSIIAHGLGWAGAEQNWPGCERGVYLAATPEICLFVMMEQLMKYMTDEASPKQALEDMRVIIIDDSRIDPRRLGPDPLIERDDVWLYDGVIDVRSQTVVTVDAVMATLSPGEPDPNSEQHFHEWVRACLDSREEAESA